jgi:hypothetical protein
MANDRMWLTNKVTGEQVLIARHDGVRWYVAYENLDDLIEEHFDKSFDQTYSENHSWAIEYDIPDHLIDNPTP